MRSTKHQPKYTDFLTGKYAANLFILIIFVFYVVAPIAIYATVTQNTLYLMTSALAGVTIIGIMIGNKIPSISWNGKSSRLLNIINEKTFINIIIIFFFIFIGLTLVTAETIPIVSALKGASADILSDERGEFFKGREGGWIILLYLSSIFTSSVIPFAIIYAIQIKHKFRHVFVTVFLIFSVLFLVKALFLNLLIPFISYGIEKNPKQTNKILTLAAGSLGILLLMIWLSGYGSLETDQVHSTADYFTAKYIPTGVFDFLIYRTFSIPIFSVVDTLHVYATQLNSELLLGSTSTLLASIAGVEKINVERLVFAYQYGGWNPFANSNVVFFVDGYINFSWFGVLIFGILIGKIFKIFSGTNNIAIRSLALLFAMQIFSSPFIQMLLSNGWILILLVAINSKKYHSKNTYNN